MKGLHQWFLVFCSLFGAFIQLNAQPGPCEAGFNITLQTGLTIEFNNLSDYLNSTGNFPPVSWDFGDNQTSTDYHPVHTYTNAGVYQVCVTASDGLDCQATFCDNVWVGTVDCDDFIVDVNNSGLTVSASIYDPSNSGPSFPDVVEWYIPDPTGDVVIGNQPNLTYTFPSGGIQTVCLDYEIDGIFCLDNCYTILLSDDPADCSQAQIAPVFTTTPNSTGLTLVFQNQSTSLVNNNLYYLWDFGDNTTSIEENPVHTYNQTGSYSVCLTMGYDAGPGCEVTVCSTYTVVDPTSCYIDFFVDQTAGLSYTFETFPEPDPMTQYQNLLWTIYDGVTIIHTAMDDPTGFTFPSAGSYIVCVDADLVDLGVLLCPVSSCQNITVVDSNPSCNFGISYTLNGNLSGNFQLLDNDTNLPVQGGVSWYLDDPNNLLGSDNPISFNFPDYGVFQVCADYETLGNACTGTICETVTVIEPNDTTCVLNWWYDWAGGLDYVLGTFQAPNPNTSYTAVVWNIFDAQGSLTSVSGDPVTYTFPTPGDYTICGLATVQDALGNVICLVDSCSMVTIDDPNACGSTFSIGMGGSGLTIDFLLSNDDPNGAQPNIANWYIANGGGPIGTGTTISYTFPAEGDYTVCVDYELSGTTCIGTLCIDITLDDPCAYEIDYLINGQTIDLTISNPGFPAPDIATWFIDGPNGSVIGNGENIQYMFPEGGVYTVCIDYQVFGQACPAVICETVTIVEDCVAAFSVTPLTVTDFQFNDLSSGNYSNTEWDFGDGAVSTMANPLHFYFVEGIYTVCLTIYDNDNFCQSTICQDITVDFSPICNNVILNPAFDITPNSTDLTLVFANNSTSNQTDAIFYIWDFGDGNTSVQENPVHTYAIPGTYTVCLTMGWDGNVACYADPICIDYTVSNPPVNCDILWDYNFVSNTSAVFQTTPPPTPGVSYNNIVWEFYDYDSITTYTGDPVTIDFPSVGIFQICVTADVVDANGNVICTTTECEVIDLDPNEALCNNVPIVFDIDETTLEGYFELPYYNASYLSWENISWVISSSVLTAGSSTNPFFFTFPGPDLYQVCVSADLTGPNGEVYCSVFVCETIPLFPPTSCESIWEGGEHLVPGAQENEAIFSNQSVGPYTEVLWDFGDGETSNSTDDELTHVYANPGVYNVCLTVADVNNPDCNDINCQLIFISGINPCQFELDILVDVDVISATVEDPNGNIPTQTDWYILESMTPIGTTSPVVYTFIETGVYTICVDLSVPGTTCMATLCEEITISNPDCAILECVFPGDADYNQVASNFDLLNLGLGFGAIGTDRVNASNDWFGQPSAAWNQSFQDGTNYKHADCNGDGIINFDDVLPIIQNYNRTHDFIQPTNFGDNPDIFLIFEIDTLNVTNDMIDLEINADIFVGTQNLPVNNLYGLAFTIAYPADLVQEGTAEGQYAGDQWFSPANTTLKLEVDDSDEGALDFAYSRTNLMNVSGFGQIATCKFVISDNLMGFNSVEEFLFNVSITDIMAVNALGQPILLDGQGDQVIILVDDTSTSTEEILENPIRIFPNPSSSVINIEWQDAKGQSIRMFNTLGKLVHEAELNDYRTSIQVANFASGIYLISIQTESGTLTRRVMVE